MIKAIPEQERPREKMLAKGSSALSNAELLAILIRTGTRERSAIDLAQDLLMCCNEDLTELRSMTVQELCKVNGVGPSKACQILAGIEFGNRMRVKPLSSGTKITSPTDVVATFVNELAHERVEKFIVVFLNTKNTVINWEVISIGSLNASIVHPREVFNKAIRKSAAAIIILHNHPSGDTSPSREDGLITERLYEAGKLLGIELLDHIIIGANNYYSFKEHGRL